jgi:hypothetical protein
MTEKKMLKRVKHRQPTLDIPDKKVEPNEKKKRIAAVKKSRIALDVRESLKEEFKTATEVNGDTMTDTLKEFMEYYVRQTRKKNADYNKAYLERKKQRGKKNV